MEMDTTVALYRVIAEKVRDGSFTAKDMNGYRDPGADKDVPVGSMRKRLIRLAEKGMLSKQDGAYSLIPDVILLDGVPG